MLLLYVVTIFVSAGLLFIVQPLFARMALPLLGGSPAVWNTALVFYQATLLLGYAYAHLSSRHLPIRRQVLLHAIALAAPILVLPLTIAGHGAPPGNANPIPWLLGLLATGVGLPFFVVSTSGPLLQRWFARTGHAQSHDPYFLYAASNLGSLLGLLAYPLIVEPAWAVRTQSVGWTAGYALLAVLTLLCGWRAIRAEDNGAPATPARRDASGAASALPWRRVGRWVMLAFVPSSLMIGVTTHLTTDVGSMPLLWVVPLGLYLVTFTLAFAQRQVIPRRIVLRLLPMLLVLLTVVLAARANEPFGFILALDLLVLFAIGYVFHGLLADDRPAAEHLTAFYLWIAIGGVLGGVFNALIAPLVFHSVVEYPLIIVLATLLCPPFRGGDPQRPNRLDFVLPLAVAAFTLGVAWFVQTKGLSQARIAVLLAFGWPAFAAFSFSRRPLRFGLGLAAVLVASSGWEPTGGHLLHEERSFFGVHRVVATKGGKHLLLHGSTFHGLQWIDPALHGEPLSYYHRNGPFGQIFAGRAGQPGPLHVGLVGLGAGALVAYARPGDSWTAYEIDPAVVAIARNTKWFTYIADAPVDLRVVTGDGRLTLTADRDARYDVLVLDAYSSDAIPVHLLTREAVALYANRLAPGGIMAFNISNRHLDLRPVVAAIARDQGLACRIRNDLDVTPDEYAAGRFPARVAVVAKSEADLGALAHDPRWVVPPLRPGLRLWTDDYSSLVAVFGS